MRFVQSSVSFQIFLVAAVPLLAFVVSQTFTIRSLFQEIAIVREMEGNIPLFAAASTAIDRLQKERGITALAVSGQVASTVLTEARAATDTAIQTLLSALPQAALGDFSVTTYRDLPRRVAELRAQAGASTPETVRPVVDGYSAVIGELLRLENAIVNVRTTKGLGKILGGLIVLESAKESAGQLRALGAWVLAAGKPLESKDFNRLLALKADVDAGLNSPALVLSEASRRKLAAELPASAHWQRTEAMLANMIQHAQTGDFGIPSPEYFQTISQKIADLEAIIVDEVQRITNRNQAISKEATRSFWLNISIAVFALAITLATSLYLGTAIVRRIRHTSDALAQIAQGEGDLTQRLPEGADELGQLARDFNRFVASMATLVRSVRGVSQQLGLTSESTSVRASQMDAGIHDASARANTVAVAAEEMTANAASVAHNMTQAAANLRTVAAAAEEMSATIQEVSSQAGQARSISQEAGAQVQEVQRILAELVGAAEEIGSVSQAIAAISSQTNLLALNATIEAARAGEAGRGFAVVAGEIKELANQTAQATGQIRQRIEGVQNATGSVSSAMDRFAQVFQHVGSIVTSIAAVIEEQAAAMGEMAGNIAKASGGVQESRDLADQNATVARSIGEEIARVNEATAQLTAASRETLENARHLAALATDLQGLVGRFRLD
jgi:methyl-accepting chemotaxis protein